MPGAMNPNQLHSDQGFGEVTRGQRDAASTDLTNAFACNDMMDADGDGVAGVAMVRGGQGLVDIDGDGIFDMQYGQKITHVKGATTNPGGADGSKSMETPRPDGPQPTEQQINEGPYTGRHAGGWKMKRNLLEPEESKEWGRHTSMSNVTGTFFAPPKERWFEAHNSAVDTPPAADFKQRLYPLDRNMYSPWEATVADKTPISKNIGSFYAIDPRSGAPTGAKQAGRLGEIQPKKEVSGSSFATAHIQGHVQPKSKGVPDRLPIKAQVKAKSMSDNTAWSMVREGDESKIHPDPSWGYTGHYAAKRFDRGEEDMSMASRISRRRQQSIERRFSASPYAAHIAQDVLRMGDGVEPPDIGPYGWAAFPPIGLQPHPDDVDGLAPWESMNLSGSRIDVNANNGRTWDSAEFD